MNQASTASPLRGASPRSSMMLSLVEAGAGRSAPRAVHPTGSRGAEEMAAIPSPRLSSTRTRAPRSQGALLAWILWGLAVVLLLGFILLYIMVTGTIYQSPTLFPSQLAQRLRPSDSDWITTPLTLVTA